MNNLLPLNKNSFANDVFNYYSRWWGGHAGLFTGQEIGKDKSHLVQREYAEDASQRKKSRCPLDAIPYIEITPLYRIAEGGILFVNCNPSGTDYDYYRDYFNKNSCVSPLDSFYYDNPKNTYFDAVERFIREGIGTSVQYAMIDVFPLVIQNQAVLKKAIADAFKNESLEGRKNAIIDMLKRFVDSITQIRPKVIVATNAFVKDLFTDNDEKRPYTLRQLELLDDIKEDNQRVCYHIKIKGLETTLFSGGMIAGGHQMDTESKKRLIRDVRYYYSEQRGFPR